MRSMYKAATTIKSPATRRIARLDDHFTCIINFSPEFGHHREKRVPYSKSSEHSRIEKNLSFSHNESRLQQKQVGVVFYSVKVYCAVDVAGIIERKGNRSAKRTPDSCSRLFRAFAQDAPATPSRASVLWQISSGDPLAATCNQQAELPDKTRSAARCCVVSLQPHLDRFRPVILPLKQLPVAAIAPARDFGRAFRHVVHCLAFLARPAAAQPRHDLTRRAIRSSPPPSARVPRCPSTASATPPAPGCGEIRRG